MKSPGIYMKLEQNWYKQKV